MNVAECKRALNTLKYEGKGIVFENAGFYRNVDEFPDPDRPVADKALHYCLIRLSLMLKSPFLLKSRTAVRATRSYHGFHYIIANNGYCKALFCWESEHYNPDRKFRKADSSAIKSWQGKVGCFSFSHEEFEDAKRQLASELQKQNGNPPLDLNAAIERKLIIRALEDLSYDTTSRIVSLTTRVRQCASYEALHNSTQRRPESKYLKNISAILGKPYLYVRTYKDEISSDWRNTYSEEAGYITAEKIEGTYWVKLGGDRRNVGINHIMNSLELAQHVFGKYRRLFTPEEFYDARKRVIAQVYNDYQKSSQRKIH